MVFENKVKKLLAEGKPAWGSALPDPSTLVAKLSIDTGVDYLWIDTEHFPYGSESIPMIPLLCRMNGCVPIVRVAGLDPNLIKKALDIGAAGIMIPQINNAEEARLAVQYAKYPPQGTRGVSPTWTFYMNIPYEEYLPHANEEICIVVQIESPEGIKNLEAIAAVEGVDVLMAGPMDLSASLGYIGQIAHPKVQEFLEEFPQRVAKCGKPSGTSLAGVDTCKKAYTQGYRLINIGHILRQGSMGIAADLKQLKEWVESLTSVGAAEGR